MTVLLCKFRGRLWKEIGQERREEEVNTKRCYICNEPDSDLMPMKNEGKFVGTCLHCLFPHRVLL